MTRPSVGFQRGRIFRVKIQGLIVVAVYKAGRKNLLVGRNRDKVLEFSG